MFSRLFTLTRFAIYIPIIGSWIAALASVLVGGYTLVVAILSMFNGLDQKAAKMLVINLIGSIDMFLLGMTFYIISIGLYELFIDEISLAPDWLVFHDLDTLKNKLLSVVVVILVVQFLAYVLGWQGDNSILTLGLSIASVILAVAVFMSKNGKKAG
jgi:uncharacterized membrane protein YqhA